MFALRHRHPALRRRPYPADLAAVHWFRPDGGRMTGADWADPRGKGIALVLSGSLEEDLDDAGEPMLDDDLAILVNAWWEPISSSLGWADGRPRHCRVG